MTIAMKTIVLAAILGCIGCTTMGAQEMPVGTTGFVPTAPVQVAPARPGVLPVGQQLDVRLQDTLSSETAIPEQRFFATTVVNIMQDGYVLVPAGSVVRGVVTSVDRAGRVDRTGRLTLAFDQLMIDGRAYPIRALAIGAFESGGIREEAGRIGTAGAVGAIVGGIIGGFRGALIGAVVGGGGVIAATEGRDVLLPAGAIIRIRLDAPVQVS